MFVTPTSKAIALDLQWNHCLSYCVRKGENICTQQVCSLLGLGDALVYSYSGYRENTQTKPVGETILKEGHTFRRVKTVKAWLLHTSLICPFSVLACPTVIFLKKRSFVSRTEKEKDLFL